MINFGRRARRLAALMGIGLGFGRLAQASLPPVPYVTAFEPGTPAESAAVVKNSGATVMNGARLAMPGQFWIYGFAVAPGESCLLSLTLDDNGQGPLPDIIVPGADNKPLPTRFLRAADGALQVIWTVPNTWPISGVMSVLIGAKTAPVRVLKARFVVREHDRNGDGLPDNIALLLTQGLPPNTRVSVPRPLSRPYTSLQTPRAPEPALDIPTDAIFAYTPDAGVIQGWKARGYAVWTMGGSREGKAYADQHKDELQTDAAGAPITIGGDSYYLMPTANRNAIERARYEQALANGSDGVCPEEPEFFARGGYGPLFKQAWQNRFNAPWQRPDSSLDNQWRAGQLMATLEADHIASVLNATQTKPGARRMVALHSPLNYAQWGIICPQARIAALQGVQDIIGQVWTGTARTPVRYEGRRADRTFSVAYLEYSSLFQIARGTGKRLWFLMDPLEDDPGRSQTDYKSHYEQTLIAALLFPEVDSYEAMPWPDRIYGHVPADYAIEIDTVLAALQDMHEQSGVEGNAVSGANIGVFVSDSMQWQRVGPEAGDFDGVFGLTLPLLERGVPVQMVSLDRAAEPGYLKPFKTLLLSYDFQKPPDSRAQMALADWVRHGGALLFFGGSDAYNAVTDSWWAQAHLSAPQDDLWARLGIHVGGAAKTARAPAEDPTAFTKALEGDGAERNLRNRRRYMLDLTKASQQTGSVAVRFTDVTPKDGWGAWLASAELRIGGQLAAAFAAGSDIESRFLVYDNNSQFSGQARFADGTASWTYQFDHLPPNQPIELTLDIGNGFAVSVAAAKPNYGHTLLGTGAVPPLEKAFPRLRIDPAYPATLYPGITAPTADPKTPHATASRPGSGVGRVAVNAEHGKPDSSAPTALYALRSGGAPVWMQSVGDGLVLHVGVAPGFFSANERSAGLLRALVQYGHQRAGGVYREPRSLRLRRGRYTIVRTFETTEEVEGRTIDLLSPTLAIAEDRTIPSRSLALLYDLGDDDDPPHIGFVSGRVEAKVETAMATGFCARGPLHTTGVARLHAGGKTLAGAKAMDRLGRPVGVSAEREGDTVLLRYANDPDGVVVRVGWK